MGSNELEVRRQPPLNFDVLRSICNNLTEVLDVLSFSLTCSSLRKGALQRRLGMSPVVLSSPESVEMFHRFIFADPAARAPFLYGLVLSLDDQDDDIPEDGSSFQKHLVAILEAATRLEHLGFSTTVGYSVCSAVAKITTLRELTVVSDPGCYDPRNPEPLTTILTDLRSPLRHMWIADYEQGQISLSFLHGHLSYFAPTLESLTWGSLPFKIDAFPVTTPFTAMRSLSIYATHQFAFYRLDVLLNLFPNLDDTLFIKDVIPPVEEYLALRKQNQATQTEHTWLGLSRVTYSPALAFTMALRCPIRYMGIHGPVLDEVRYLTEVFRDNCPQRLMLPIALFGHDHLLNLDGLFPPQAGDRLTHLVLFVEADVNRRRLPSGQYTNFSWDQFMDAFVHATKHLRRLTHLRVVLHYNIHPPVSDCALPEPDNDGAFIQNIAHDTDLYPAAVRLLDTSPALEYVLLTTCGARRFGQPWKYWHSSKAWRVQEVVSDLEDRLCGPLDETRTYASGPISRSRLCMEISSEAAEVVIDEEELHLGEREEKMVSRCAQSASE